MKKKILLHIGMPKCGSTYLQHEIFQNINDCYFTTLSKKFIKSCPIADFIDRTRYCNPLTFDIKKEKEILWNFINKLDCEDVIISWEGLIGDPFNNFANSQFIADTLMSIFPEAKVLLVVRRQSELIESLYKQTLHQFHSIKFKTYTNNLRDVDRYRPMWMNGLNLNVSEFNFLAIAKKYSELYGKQNLTVVPFEYLRMDKTKFLKIISKFIGRELRKPNHNKFINQSYSVPSAAVARFTNKFINTGFNQFGFLSVKTGLKIKDFLKKLDGIKFIEKKYMTEEEKIQVMAYYANSNERLEEYSAATLKDLQYY